MAMVSTARLAAKLERLGVSMGSQGSEAPVSFTAHPPRSAAATAVATTEQRTRVAIFDTLAIINANPGPSPPARKPGHRRKTARFAAVPQGVLHTARAV